MLFSNGVKSSLYAATDQGLYYTADNGRTWKRIFRGKNYLERQCLSTAILPGAILLGTRGGLFRSEDNGRLWKKTDGELGRDAVVCIEIMDHPPRTVYAASREHVFQSEDGGATWDKIFSLIPRVQQRAEEEMLEQDADTGNNLLIRDLAVSRSGTVYIAATRGLFKRESSARDWEKITDSGLRRQAMCFVLAVEPDVLIAADAANVYLYERDVWRVLAEGLISGTILHLSRDTQNRLYACLDSGLFTVGIPAALSGSVTEKDGVSARASRSDGYPSISVIQQAAIEYAEVELEKIKTWRKQAAKRAWLPTVSVSVDRDRNRTISSNTWGTYGSNGSAGRYFVGPEDISSDHNENWGVSLSWDLGDLVWNDDQTSIDVRSKLMVELRGQVLDEVTKLYFESLRLRAELEDLGLEELKKKAEKKLKLNEVTAMLDGLTGGVFSRGKE